MQSDGAAKILVYLGPEVIEASRGCLVVVADLAAEDPEFLELSSSAFGPYGHAFLAD